MNFSLERSRASTITSVLLRGCAALACYGKGSALLILTFHRVPARPDPLLPEEPDAQRFAALLDALRGVFNILPLCKALRLRRDGKLPARALCITFDDGYADNAEVALPLLLSRGLKATFFVATGFLKGGQMWNDSVIEAVRAADGQLDLRDLGLGLHATQDVAARRRAIQAIIGALKYRGPAERTEIATAIAARSRPTGATHLMMSEQQVRTLAARGMEIGAHTVTHPILARIDLQLARREIADSRAQLARITGAAPLGFAYPNGRPGTDYGREHVEMVRNAGFEHAVSTAWGCVTDDADPLQLPRIAPWGSTGLAYLLRTVRSYRDRRAEIA